MLCEDAVRIGIAHMEAGELRDAAAQAAAVIVRAMAYSAKLPTLLREADQADDPGKAEPVA